MTALEQDRQFLLRSLEDLERERAAGDLDDADYQALRDDYTARAAAVLRAIERGEADVGDDAVGPEAAATGVGGQRRSRRRSVAVALAVVAFAGGAGALVARSAGERAPGDPATGAITPTGPSAGIAADLVRARELAAGNRTLDAIKLYDAILERDPGQPEALAYRGWLLRLAGRRAANPELIDKGLEYIERAVAADPGYPDARFFRGVVLFQDRNDPAAAIPDFQAFLAADPPRPLVPMVEDLLRRASAEAEARAKTAAEAPAG